MLLLSLAGCLADNIEPVPRAAHGLVNLLKGGHPPYHVRLPCLTYKQADLPYLLTDENDYI